jgi:hypothetical protein
VLRTGSFVHRFGNRNVVLMADAYLHEVVDAGLQPWSPDERWLPIVLLRFRDEQNSKSGLRDKARVRRNHGRLPSNGFIGSAPEHRARAHFLTESALPIKR